MEDEIKQLYNLVEWDAILFYADFLSMRARSVPVTDNCVYFYIHGTPVNVATVWADGPFYNENDIYLQLSIRDYNAIRNKYDKEGVDSFIEEICSLKHSGKVDGDMMLRYIHLYSPKQKRKEAYRKYREFNNNIIYKHIVKDEDGRTKLELCSQFIAHQEKHKAICERPDLLIRNENNDQSTN